MSEKVGELENKEEEVLFMRTWNQIKSWGGPNPGLRLFTVMGSLIAPLLVFANWMALNGWEAGFLNWFGGKIVQMLALFAIMGLWIFPLLAWEGKRPRWGLKWFASCVLMLMCLLAGVRISSNLVEKAYIQFTLGSAPLVTALHKFTKDQRHPPATLADLVPAYLSAVPHPSIGSGSEYVYRKEGQGMVGNPWTLHVSVPTLAMEADEFYYLPHQNYDEIAPITQVEMVGGWGIVPGK